MAVDDAQELTQEHIDNFLGRLRALGLYENRVRRLSAEDPGEQDLFDVKMVPSKREILIVDLLVGDIAFMPRVQAPSQADFDAQFDRMTLSFGQDEFEAAKSDIARRLAAGLDPFEDED